MRVWCSVSCTGIQRIPDGALRRHCISIYTHTIIFISIIIYIIISLICLSLLKDA